MPDQPTVSRAFSCRVSGDRAESDATVAAFVLAGGRSSRMGRDKALLPFAGEALIARAVGILREAGLQASIAGAQSSLESFAPVVADAEAGLGPLSGICAALHATAARWAVFLPVDVPLLPAPLVAYLVRHARTTQRAITVSSVCGFAQTFPAVVARAALPMLEDELSAGRRGCFAAFLAAALSLGEPMDTVAVELLVQAGQVAHPDALPAAHWFLNVNGPEELERAQALAARRPRAGGVPRI